MNNKFFLLIIFCFFFDIIILAKTIAEIRAIDRVTGRSFKLKIPLNEDVIFSNLVLNITYCYKNPIDKEDLMLFLKDKLANYKIPEVVLFTDDALPRIASEKIDRVTVKKLLS